MTDDNNNYTAYRRRVLAGLGAAGVAGLAGCTGGGGDGTPTATQGGGEGEETEVESTDSPTPETGGTLNLAQAKSPVEFDPIVLNDVPSSLIASQIFEGLYMYDEGTGHVPNLATDMPEISNDGTRYVVELKDEPRFQNGDPVTAEDVKYSFEAPVKEETENASEYNMIDTVTAVDEKTVQFDLKFPFGPFLHTLHASIVPKSVREEDKQAFNKENPVGSGPFQFDDWTEGEFARITRWEDYWGEPMPNLAEAEYVPVTEGTTRVTTLRNAENDVIQDIPPKLWSTVKGLDNASISSEPGITYFYLAFNCKEGPTADPQVREAIDYAFDMDQAVSNFVEPTGVRQYSPLPRAVAEDWNMPLNQWQNIPHGKDVDRAASMLESAGVPKDYDWTIIVPPDDKREQIGVTVANGLKEAGWTNTTVQRFEWGTFLERYITGKEEDYNMYTLGWAGTPDPDSFTYFLLSRAEDVLGVTNGTYWGANSQKAREAAQKFVQARQSANREKRQQLYQSGITTALQQRAHIPAYNLKVSYGVRDYVSGFTAHPAADFRLATQFNNVAVNKSE